jgi:D-3-phosphoglycerate dehydrogenase
VLVLDPSLPVPLVRERLARFDVEVVDDLEEVDGTQVVALLTTAGRELPARWLRSLPELQVIATASTGHDHLPIGDAAEAGIWVCNAPSYCVEEVADSTIALLLALLRGTVELDRAVRAGGWDYAHAGRLRRISETRLGLVGLGRIGAAVAARAGGLGFEVWAHDRSADAARGRVAGVRLASFEDLLWECDAISLHVPPRADRAPLIGASELAEMRRGAILVNTARGDLVDTEALLAALDSGALAGAALDVLPVEPPSNGAPRHRKLIVTPHAAWCSADAEHRAVDIALRQLATVLEGASPEEGVVVRPPGGSGRARADATDQLND